MKATVFGLLIGWAAFNALTAVAAIGRERKPVDPFTAVIVLVIGRHDENDHDESSDGDRR